MRTQQQRPDCSKAMFGAVATALLILSTGCAPCGGPEEPPAPALQQVERPDSPAEVSLGIAARFPDSTSVFVGVRDPRAISAAYAGLRPHLLAVAGSEVGMIETDMRNTLGIDLLRPETLTEAGLAADGGFGISLIGERPVGVIVLSDARVFEERIIALLRGRPFNLDGEMERRREGNAQVIEFKRAADSTSALAVIIDAPYAFIVPRAEEAGLDSIITALVNPPANSLSASPRFQASVEAAEHYQVQLYMSPRAVAVATPQEAIANGRILAPDHVSDEAILAFMQGIGELTFGLRLGGTAIETRLVQTPDAAVITDFNAVTAATGEPGFAPLAVPDVYGFVRLTLAPQRLLDIVRSLVGDEQRASIDTMLTRESERLGVSVEEALFPALGNTALLLLTRARLLTLSRAMSSGSPGEFFSGLGVVIAYEVEDAAQVRTALQNLAQTMEERANLFEEGGATVVEFTDAQADIGNVVLTDDFLLLVPARQRSEVVEQLAGHSSDLSWIDVAGARALITEPSANGLFIDVQRVVDGPIGQVAFARLPAEVRRLLGRMSRLHSTTAARGDTLVTDVVFGFAEEPAENE